jgi:cytochrome c oxidase assembly protein subunit 15
MQRSSASSGSAVRGPHRFAIVLACCVVLLISAGGLVKSLEAGLSVPDWPLSYGSLNPPRWWEIENVRAEHGHRLIAGTVALMTVALCVWTYRREERGWVKRLSLLAVITVLAQALLGGLTVLFFLPTAISVSHAALAQLFLCMIVTLAVVTSSRWPRDKGRDEGSQLLRLAPITTGAIYVQILIGAVMRHTGAGLAIPDFPLAFGRLVPPEFTFPITIHYTHRLGAVVVAGLIISTIVQAARCGWAHAGVRLPAVGLGLLVIAQITLGATVVLTGKAVLWNTMHVGVGALVLATSVVLSLNGWRLGGGEELVAASEPTLEGVAG